MRYHSYLKWVRMASRNFSRTAVTSNCCSSFPRMPSSYQVVLWKQERFVVLRPLQIEFFRNLLEPNRGTMASDFSSFPSLKRWTSMKRAFFSAAIPWQRSVRRDSHPPGCPDLQESQPSVDS